MCCNLTLSSNYICLNKLDWWNGTNIYSPFYCPTIFWKYKHEPSHDERKCTKTCYMFITLSQSTTSLPILSKHIIKAMCRECKKKFLPPKTNFKCYSKVETAAIDNFLIFNAKSSERIFILHLNFSHFLSLEYVSSTIRFQFHVS